MGGFGSGGANRLSIEEHMSRGTLRPARHLAAVTPASAASAPASLSDRRAVLKGLAPTGHKVASRLLRDYGDWDAAGLHTLRQYALSCDRLAELVTDDDGRRAEVRVNLALLRAMHLDAPR